MPSALYAGLNRTLDLGIEERIKRLAEFARKIHESDQTASDHPLRPEQQLHEKWAEFESKIRKGPDPHMDTRMRDRFIQSIEKAVDLHGSTDYTAVIRSLGHSDAEFGTAWLDGIVENLLNEWSSVVSF